MSIRFFYGVGACLLVVAGVFLQDATSTGLNMGLSEVQKSALKELKSAIIKDLPHSYMKEDGYLLRWLTARNFNLEDAKSSLLQHVAWRKMEMIDSILDEDFSSLEKRFPYDINSVNKNGLPVLALEYGKWNLKEELKTPEEFKMLARYRIKILEDAEKKTREMREKNNRMEESPQFDVIDNLQGYSEESHECSVCMEFAEEGMNVTKAQYPGAISNIFFVNSPPAFEKTFAEHIQKLPERCKKSFRVLHGKESYVPVISQFIEMNQFPKFL